MHPLDERNKKLALDLIRAIANDIAEDNVLVLDTGLKTEDNRNPVDLYATYLPDQVVTLRIRRNPAKDK